MTETYSVGQLVREGDKVKFWSELEKPALREPDAGICRHAQCTSKNLSCCATMAAPMRYAFILGGNNHLAWSAQQFVCFIISSRGKTGMRRPLPLTKALTLNLSESKPIKVYHQSNIATIAVVFILCIDTPKRGEAIQVDEKRKNRHSSFTSIR